MIRILLVAFSILAHVHPDVAGEELKQPIYGARSLKDGSIRLNPKWADPVRSLLVISRAIQVIDTESKTIRSFPLPEKTQDYDVRCLLGPVIAIVGDGEVVKVVDQEQTTLIMTDKEGVRIAEVLLPLVLERLSSDDKVQQQQPALTEQIQGRWIADHKQEVEPDAAEEILELARYGVNSIDGQKITFAESFDPGAKRQTWTFSMDANKDLPQIRLTGPGDDVELNAVMWAHTGKPAASAYRFVFTRSGDEYPTSVEQKPGIIHMTYKRDETDPVWMRNEAKALRAIAVRNLLSNQVTLYPTARNFLRSSIAMDEEADLLQKSQDELVQAAAWRAEQRFAEARIATKKAEEFKIKAEQRHAQRIEQLRHDEEVQRNRSKADQLVMRIEAFRSEGEFALARDIQLQLNELLRGQDEDNFHITDLQRRSVAARLDGNHQLAEQLNQQATELRLALQARYEIPNDPETAAAESTAVRTETKSIALKYSKVNDSVEILQSLGLLGDDLAVTSPRDNVMILIGTPDLIKQAVEIVQTIDEASHSGGGQTPSDPGDRAEKRDLSNRSFLLQQLQGLAGGDTVVDSLPRQVPGTLSPQDASSLLFPGTKPLFEGIDWNPVITQQQAKYEAAERAAAKAADQYRRITGTTPADEGRRSQLKTELRDHVRSAFRLRMILQLMQLEKANSDLRLAAERLKRRRALSEQVVQRRVDDLLSGGELSWLPSDDKKQPKVRSAGRARDVSDPVTPPPKHAPAMSVETSVDDEQMAAMSSEVLKLLKETRAQVEKDLKEAEAIHQRFVDASKMPAALPETIADVEDRRERSRLDVLRKQKLLDQIVQRIKEIDPSFESANVKAANEPTRDPQAKNLVLSLHEQPYVEVIIWLASVAAVPAQFDATPAGTFSHQSVQPMSVVDFVEVLNRDLASQNMTVSLQSNQLIVRRSGNEVHVVVPKDKQPGSYREAARITSGDLEAVCSVVISPDGRHLYAAARDAQKLLVFRRDGDRDGQLTTLSQTIHSQDDLDGILGLRVTPNGKYVIATSFVSRTVTLFARDRDSGMLKRTDVARDAADGVIGLHWAFDCEVSPDSKFLYVTSSETLDDASNLVTTGAGNVTVFQIVDDQLKWIETHTGRNDCFDGAAHISIHPTGKWLYVANYRSNSIVVIARDDETGKLQIQQIVRDNGILSLDGVHSVACSPDGKHLYSSSGRFRGEHGVTAFRIKTAADLDLQGLESGSLSPIQIYRGGPGGLTEFEGGNRVIVSADGKTVFVMASLSGTLSRLTRDPATGRLSNPATVRLTPSDGSLGPASFDVSQDGKHIYAAAQDHQSVIVLERDPNADPPKVEVTPPIFGIDQTVPGDKLKAPQTAVDEL